MKTILKTRVDPLDLWLRRTVTSELNHKQIVGDVKKFLNVLGLTPEELINRWKAVRFEYQSREVFLEELNEAIETYFIYNLEDYSPKSKHTSIYRVISFFKKGCKIPIKPEFAEKIYVKYHNRDITPEEIKRILTQSGLKFQTFFLMMVESGQRPYTLVRLRYKHIKKDFEANRVPMSIDLPSELLKDNVGDRFSFIGQDGFNLLKEYLASRGQLNPEDLVFAPDKTTMKGDHLSVAMFSNKFGKIVRQLKLAEDKGGKPKALRLYCLRKYFRNNLKMDRDYREFLMGHTSTLGVDQSYITRDKEVYRVMYEEAYPTLRIYAEQKEETITQVKELREILTTKDQEIKDLTQKVEQLTSVVSKIMRDGAVEEAFTAFYATELAKAREEIKAQVLKELREKQKK